MRNRQKKRATVAFVLTSILAMLIGATPTAVAATTVTKSGATLTITGDAGNSNIRVIRDGRRIRVFDGSKKLSIANGPATVNNIDTINGDLGDGADRLTIDLAGGLFAPGLSPEGTGKSEIEFAIGNGGDSGDVHVIRGRSTADSIVLNGIDGFDLNSDGDGEVFPGNTLTMTVDGRGGDDIIAFDAEVNGCTGLVIQNMNVKGGEGNDALSGSGHGQTTIIGGPGDDQLLPTECDSAPAVTMFGGSGNDQLTGAGGADTLSGGDGKDIIRGFDGTDQLRGDDGNDRLFGGSDADSLNGGRDTDTCHGEGSLDAFSKCETQIQ